MEKSPRPKNRRPRPLTDARLQDIALRYVGRYAATRAMLLRVLERHILRASQSDAGFDAAKARSAAQAIASSYEKRGWIDDAAFAARLAESGKAGGKSRAKLTQKLTQKGIAPALIRATFEHAPQDEDDLEAALAFAKRRKLGPWRGSRVIERDKELARLARAGFSMDIAARVLKMPAEAIAYLEDTGSPGDDSA